MSDKKHSELLEEATEAFNRMVPWHELPVPLGVLNLIEIRNVLRDENLHDTETLARSEALTPPPRDARHLHGRSADGSHNDLQHPCMGMAGTRFGRNVPLEHGRPDPEKLLTPNPREVSLRLLTRGDFQPASSLNVLAAAWIQFMTHDWFNHETTKKLPPHKVPLDPGDPWPEHPMHIDQTRPDPTRPLDSADAPPTYVNTVTHWWDASQLYGSDDATLAKLRSGVDGKLALQRNGLLPVDPEKGIDLTGFNENWWLGLGLLHTLFTLEHNAICDQLKAAYPSWDDDALFIRARLINAALMAKIHTVEWTPGILAHPTLKVAMNANWWGLATQKIHELVGRISDSDVISGIPGSSTDHHGTPYSMTEEFVSVYRMHSLMPDEYALHSVRDGQRLKALNLREVTGKNARALMESMRMEDLIYSLGVANPGALTLHNYPRLLQHLVRPDGSSMDLAAVDILRDRERGVPRYNQFRRLLQLDPVSSFEDLCPDPEWREQLRAVYSDDLEQVDLMVGMLAEPKPKGFGFSDTAFRVFILMASRRLKSDRFFTTHYTPEVYTPEGLKWVAENTMQTVLQRHFPALTPALMTVENAFAPWGHVR